MKILSGIGVLWEKIIPINQSLQPGEIGVVDPLKGISEKLSHHNYRTLVSDQPDRSKRYLHSSALWENCILLDPQFVDGPNLKILESILGKITNTFSVRATLYYRSSKHKKWMSHDFPVKGLIHISTSDECNSMLQP